MSAEKLQWLLRRGWKELRRLSVPRDNWVLRDTGWVRVCAEFLCCLHRISNLAYILFMPGGNTVPQPCFYPLLLTSLSEEDLAREANRRCHPLGHEWCFSAIMLSPDLSL